MPGPDPNIVWVALVWTLTVSVAFVLTRRFSDLFGRRWFFIGSNFIGLVGAVLGGTAKSVNQLIIGNALNGIAAAVQLSFTVVIAELLPNKWRWYVFCIPCYTKTNEKQSHSLFATS
jgi:MFS family permease